MSHTIVTSLIRMPCLFYRERSNECLFQRLVQKYSSGKTIKETIDLAIQSIVRGLKDYHNEDVSLSKEDFRRISDEMGSFIIEGLDKPVSDDPPCMGLFLSNKGYSCPIHSLYLDVEKYDSILNYIGSPEDPGCLCYFSALVRCHGIVSKSTIEKAKEYLAKK
ncbi:MAG: hypothetical protein ACW963_02460 [Candidatus Sifarchaeia archaeon]